ncbi:YkuS family protein [Clostridium fallax]|uniref:Uncharacterized protein family (UPF0180) n=1 Tax=Clostridium fallax TaxID=1533 RepID=A0A1M4X2T2_9CLOT|nr:YkuS family protein [Clostridium fallax]SHE87643.1 Uncharacterised protein family (UPF0180) [Clostridium fallax]SQB22538.1 Uncharacterized protein family (UPF0180) [Clostridium fallax]
MNIYVSDKLKDFINPLEKKGYKVARKKDENFEALICSVKEEDLSNFQEKIKLNNILVIDSRSKSIDEIDIILRNKHFNNF